MNNHLLLPPADVSAPESFSSNDQTGAASPAPCPEAVASGETLHRKIAKLPKPLRDLINSMLDDAMPAHEIVAKLQASNDPPLPYPISEKNISDWRNTGYRRYLAEQQRLAVVQANRDGAAELIATGEITTLPEATLQILANQYYELLADFSPETLRQQLSEDPLKYTRFLNVFARLVREIVHLRKFRDASTKAAEAKLQKLDSDRDLSDNEFDAVVHNLDRLFKVARPRKYSKPPPLPLQVPTPKPTSQG